MNSQRAEQWRQILELTSSMARAAQQDDWDGVIKSEEDRRTLVDRFFSTPLAVEEANLLEDGIKRILESDAIVAARGRDLRDQCASGLKLLQQSRKASKAYQPQAT